jgi:hypothetical protein
MHIRPNLLVPLLIQLAHQIQHILSFYCCIFVAALGIRIDDTIERPVTMESTKCGGELTQIYLHHLVQPGTVRNSPHIRTHTLRSSFVQVFHMP